MNVRNFKQAAVVASNLRKVLPASSHFQGLNCVRIPYTRYLIQMCESNKRSYVTTPLSNPVLDVPVLREHALDIFNTAVNAVLPQSMVTRALQLEGNVLTVNGQSYELKHNVHIVAFGKAVIGMVRAAEDVLGDHIVGGIASVPHGIQDTLRNLGKWDLLPSSSSRVKIMEGAENNIPDEDAHKAAMEIHSLLEKLTEDDIVLALFSGGGSALLPAPVPPITLSEMAEVTKILSLKGATIQQLNTVRKHLELLKGGGLARTAFPARVLSLVLSNVIGNSIYYIASGPTSPDYSHPEQSLKLIESLDATNDIPSPILWVLNDRCRDYGDTFSRQVAFKTAKSEYSYVDPAKSDYTANLHNNAQLSNAQNLIVGSNEIAIQGAAVRARELGYNSFILSREVSGSAIEQGLVYSKLTDFICRSMGNWFGKDHICLGQEELDLIRSGITKVTINEIRTLAYDAINLGTPICILGAGETVVRVEGSGIGGRCQELALSAAVHMNDSMYKTGISNHFLIQFLCGDTDGQDGPSEAAGAVIDPSVCSMAEEQGLSPEYFLSNNDAFSFFSNFNQGKHMLMTRLTGTNVMDIHVLLIHPKMARCTSELDLGRPAAQNVFPD